VSVELPLRCPTCGDTSLADDEFCESCGAALAGPRDAERHHLEVGAGRAAGVTDRGLVHERNEDAFFVETIDRAVIAVVCDGVSTSAAPQVAAQVAAQVAGRELSDALHTARRPDASRRAGEARAALTRAITAAGKAVLEVPWLPSPGRDAPSCTVVAAMWEGTDIVVGWVGDSRAYWVDASGAQLLTVDHSWAEMQVQAGLMSPQAAVADGRAHAITRWLGADAPDEALPIASFRPVRRGWLVLCSDGLWNHLATVEELASLVAAQPADISPLALARALTRAALARGGRDNVTVLVVDIVPTEPRRAEDSGR
jgi:serine/threonine protein phosphatase PrpC